MRQRFGLALIAALGSGRQPSRMSWPQVDPNDAADKPAEIEPLAPSLRCCWISRSRANGSSPWASADTCCCPTTRARRGARRSRADARRCSRRFSSRTTHYGWAVGHDEIILNTVDGGETWTRSHFAPEAQQPLLDLWFANRVSGIAVGAYGAYFTTNDGGRHWSVSKFAPRRRAAGNARRRMPAEDELPPDHHLNRIVGVGPRLYVAAEGGQLFRSDDRGASWRALPSPYEGSFFGPCRSAAKACSPSGCAAISSARPMPAKPGTSCESHTTAMLTDGVAINDLRVVVGGLAGVLLVSARCRRDVQAHAAGRPQGNLRDAAGTRRDDRRRG